MLSSYIGAGTYTDGKKYSVNGKTESNWVGWFSKTGDDYTQETESKEIGQTAQDDKVLVPTSRYNLSINPNGGTLNGSTSVLNDTYINAEQKIYDSLERPHYTILGWKDQNNVNHTAPLTIEKGTTGNKSFTANWEQTKYPITYNLNGGGGVSNDYYTYFAAKTLGTPSRTDYKFTGWTGSNGSTPQTSVTIPVGSEGSKSYAANWADADDIVWLTTILLNGNYVNYKNSYYLPYSIETFRDPAGTDKIGEWNLAGYGSGFIHGSLNSQLSQQVSIIRTGVKCKKGGSIKINMRQTDSMMYGFGYNYYNRYSGRGYFIKIPTNASGTGCIRIEDKKYTVQDGFVENWESLDVGYSSFSDYPPGWVKNITEAMVSRF